MRNNVLSFKDINDSLKWLKIELMLREVAEKKWKKKTGELVSLKDMETGHIINTIRILEKLKFKKEVVEENPLEDY